MTKKDARTLGFAALAAALVGGALYWFGVRRKTIAEINPAIIKWEGV